LRTGEVLRLSLSVPPDPFRGGRFGVFPFLPKITLPSGDRAGLEQILGRPVVLSEVLFFNGGQVPAPMPDLGRLRNLFVLSFAVGAAGWLTPHPPRCPLFWTVSHLLASPHTGRFFLSSEAVFGAEEEFSQPPPFFCDLLLRAQSRTRPETWTKFASPQTFSLFRLPTGPFVAGLSVSIIAGNSFFLSELSAGSIRVTVMSLSGCNSRGFFGDLSVKTSGSPSFRLPVNP